MGMLIRRHHARQDEQAAPVEAFPAGKPGKAWKVDELKAYAAAHEVDLGEAKTKDEILAALTPAVTDPPIPVGDDGVLVPADPADPTDPTDPADTAPDPLDKDTVPAE